MICPVCNLRTKEWRVARVKGRAISETTMVGKRTRSGSVKTVTVEIIESEMTHSDYSVIENPSLQSEPTQYHQDMNEELRKEVSILSLVVPTKNINSPSTTISTEMIGYGKGIDESCSEEAKAKLEKIFQFLHTKLLSDFNHNLNGYEQFGATYGGHNLDEIVSSDTSTLFRCIYSLATGKIMSDSKTGVLWMNQKASAFAASDIIRNLATKRNSGALKTLLGHQLLAYTIPQALHKLLNKFGICPSHQYNRIIDICQGNDVLLRGILDEMIDPHDLWLLLYDNIGFRRRGSQPGWDQFIALQLVRITKYDLMRWGIYRDPLNPTRVLKSWDDGLKWEEVRGDTSYEDIFGTGDEDVSNLASMILTPIETLIEMEIKKELPTLDECRRLAELGRNFSWPTSIPKDQKKTSIVEKESAENISTAQVSVDEEDEIDITIADGESGQINEEEGDQRKFETNYDANNCIVDRPIELDLNSKAACMVLIEYANQVFKKVMSKEVMDDDWQDIEKAMDKYGVPLLGDGNPSIMILNILQEAPAEGDDAEKFKHVKAFTGGLHMIIETHRKRGGLFGKSHLEDFFSCWRTSIGQLNWVMNPGDPGQIDSELSMYVIAFYVAALRGLIEAKRVEFDSRDPAAARPHQPVKICAQDVIDFMLERARHYPIVMVILLEIRFAEVVFMLHQAEQDSNESLYVTALKYLAPLFAATHATKYVELLAKFLVDWHCMSSAERVIFSNGIFTRKTKNGRNIFSDRFVEWMMRDLRMWCSNVATPHTASILERTALGLNRKKKSKAFARKEMSNIRGEEAEMNKAELQINHVFCEVIIFCSEANLFGPGEIKHIQKGPASNFPPPDGIRQKGTTMREKDTGTFTQICNDLVLLNTELPKARKIGEQRMSQYFEHYHKTGDLSKASRSEKDVPLTSINPLMSENAKDLRAELARCTCTDTKMLEEYYVVEQLNTEINLLNNELRESDHSDLQIAKEGGEKKIDLCSLVRRLRLNLMNVNASWASEREAHAREALEETLTLSANDLIQFIDIELKNSFYTLKSTQVNTEETESQNLFTLPFNADRDDDADDDDDADEVGAATAPAPQYINRQSYGFSENAWI